jgi:cytochrome P450
MLRPNFTRSQVGDLPTFEKHVTHLIDAIPRNGDTVDLQELFFSLTIDSATEFLFGRSCNSLIAGRNGDPKSEFADAFNSAQEGLNRRDMLGAFAKIWPDRKFEHDLKVVRDFVDSYVEEALSQRNAEKPESDRGRYVFLHELAKETQDPIQIRSESLNVLLAGRDTTASLLSNCWFVLARRPDIWAKLRAEVDDLHGEPPTYQQLKDMKYLRYTLNESLRLHPVVPGNSRKAVRDTILPLGGGPDGKSPCFVKKGSEFAWSTYAMHRRKDFFGEDAEEFRPERWEKLRPTWEYLPFNGGPRICIGRECSFLIMVIRTLMLRRTICIDGSLVYDCAVDAGVQFGRSS